MVRVFVGGTLLSAELLEVNGDNLDTVLPAQAEKHGALMAVTPGMVEIEFLDEPDHNARFFRMGNDPSLMKQPLAVDPDKPDVLRRWGGIQDA